MPLPANVTCDIFRDGEALPAIAGVPALLMARFRKGLEAGQGLADASERFTHIALVAPDVDVRDAYLASGADTVTIADEANTSFRVVFVERRLRGSGLDHLRVYLARQAVTVGIG